MDRIPKNQRYLTIDLFVPHDISCNLCLPYKTGSKSGAELVPVDHDTPNNQHSPGLVEEHSPSWKPREGLLLLHERALPEADAGGLWHFRGRQSGALSHTYLQGQIGEPRTSENQTTQEREPHKPNWQNNKPLPQLRMPAPPTTQRKPGSVWSSPQCVAYARRNWYGSLCVLWPILWLASKLSSFWAFFGLLTSTKHVATPKE